MLRRHRQQALRVRVVAKAALASIVLVMRRSAHVTRAASVPVPNSVPRHAVQMENAAARKSDLSSPFAWGDRHLCLEGTL